MSNAMCSCDPVRSVDGRLLRRGDGELIRACLFDNDGCPDTWEEVEAIPDLDFDDWMRSLGLAPPAD